MIQAIKKQIQIQFTDWCWMLLVIIGANIAGQVMHWLIIRSDSSAETCFAMGTVMAMVMTVIFLLVMCFTQLMMYFNVEISMGFTRRHFYVSYYVFSVLFSVMSVIVVMGTNMIENQILKVLYPSLPNEIDFLPYLSKYGFIAAVFVPIVAIFCGALMLRFGRKIFWILWGIWMFCGIGIPAITEAVEHAPNTLYGRISILAVDFLQKIPVNIWIGLAGGLVLVSFVGSWMILRKQQVTA